MEKIATNQFVCFLFYRRLFLLPMLLVLFASCQRNIDIRSSQEKLIAEPMFTQYFLTLQEIGDMRLKSITDSLSQAGPNLLSERLSLSPNERKIKFIQKANSLKNVKGESYNQLLLRSIYLYTKLQIKYVNKNGMPKDQFKNVFINKLAENKKTKNPVKFQN